MEEKYGWKLIEIEKIDSPILKVDCVFQGKTEFPTATKNEKAKRMKMRKWIVFRADKRQPGWEKRKFQHTQSLTKILAEHFDSSDWLIPEVGYRPPEFVRVETEHDPDRHGYSTHYRTGDWEVARVETYTPDIPIGEFDMVVICYCQYSPIDAPLKPMPERQVSVDSFRGDKEAYQR